MIHFGRLLHRLGLFIGLIAGASHGGIRNCGGRKCGGIRSIRYEVQLQYLLFNLVEFVSFAIVWRQFD